MLKSTISWFASINSWEIFLTFSVKFRNGPTAINEDGTWRGDPNTDRFKTVNINPYSDEYEEIFPRDIGGFRFQYELPAIKKKTPVVTYAPEFYTRNPGKVPTLTKTKPFKSSPKKTTSVKKSIGKKRGM